MKNKIIKIPTGYLLIDDYEKGQLETLSIGDYGKNRNIRAEFLGYYKQINGVSDGSPMPLSNKWVVTLSTQYGCPMKCTFCDVPNIEFKGNASFNDLKKQLYSAIKSQGVKYTDRLNIHFARMGEPIFNPAVFDFTEWLSGYKYSIFKETGLRIEVIHPVLSTSLPKKFKHNFDLLQKWCWIKNNKFNGQAGLQLSINSTDNKQRDEMFNNMSLSLNNISDIVDDLPEPLGRKYCLNFAYCTDYEIDAVKLINLFDPEKFMVKITPIHNNNACVENGIETLDGYTSYSPYEKIEQELIKVGFDVLVFIPSTEEENNCVTCGNALLGGSEIK